jgi:2-amino-4-hydroxy-6-hydroxymethyldihydropteridine diphosphokinase
MAQIFLSIGSNIEREQNIISALDKLKHRFGKLELSSIYESEAVGFSGDYFLNLVVGIDAGISLDALSRFTKALEDQHGRERTGPRFASRTLDIDIVTYNDLLGVYEGIELPRPELYYNAFVLLPLAELRPNLTDPKSGKCYSELWRQLSHNQKLWKVDFFWHDTQISHFENND